MQMLRDFEIKLKVYKPRKIFILWGHKNGLPRRGISLHAHGVVVNGTKIPSDDYKINLRKDGSIAIEMAYDVNPLRNAWTFEVFGKTFVLRKAKESVITVQLVINHKIVDHGQTVQQATAEFRNRKN